MNRNISKGIYLIGFVFLALTVKTWIDYKNKPKLSLEVKYPFDLNSFLSSDNYNKFGKSYRFINNQVTALYLISSAKCSPCINEVKSYNIFLNDKNLNKLPVKQLVVVLDPDMKRAKRFVKITNFQPPVVFGFDKKFAGILCKFGKSEIMRQLIFIHNNSGTIFFRAYLKKGKMTSNKEKNDVFSKAQEAFLKLKTTN